MNNAKSSPILIRFFILLILALCEMSALAATATWTGGADHTTWFNPLNWDTHLVPDLSTDVFINNGDTVKIIGGSALARSLTLGFAKEDSGTVQVIGGSLVLPSTDSAGTFPNEGAIFVGYEGRGTLSITTAGIVNCGYGWIAAIKLPPESKTNSNGVVTVDGALSRWTLTGDDNGTKLFVGGSHIAEGGTGLLSITNGGNVTINNPNNNTAVRVGGSATLTADNGTLAANGPDPFGKLVVVDGTLGPSKTFTIDGYLGFNPSATTVLNVRPQDVNVVNINVAETATLNGRLQVTMTGPGFTPGMRFTLLHATNGLHFPGFGDTQFANVSINFPVCPVCAPAFTPVIQYDYNAGNVYLYLDPE